jgi:acetoin utilization deacetylase AcuC-like enzyme
MAPMQAFHSDRHLLPLPPGHRFPRTKYRLLRERVAAFDDLETREADAASDADLCSAHGRRLRRRRRVGDARRGGAARDRLPLERGDGRAIAALGRRDRRAARAALAEGVACNLAGGTHHASAARGSGYCVFNDVAVAARILQREAPLRVVVVDLDVHQGDGTATIFAGDPTVFTISLHGARNFPFRKATSDLDIGLADGCGDADYLQALERALAVVAGEHAERPFGLAFYLAGADPHEGDRLGRLKLTGRRLARSRPPRPRPARCARHPGRTRDGRRLRRRPRRHGRDPAATVAAAISAWHAWRERLPAASSLVPAQTHACRRQSGR